MLRRSARTVLTPRVAGRVMVVVGGVGIVVGLLGTIVGWRLVGHLHRGVDQSLGVASTSLVTVDDSITLLGRILDDVEGGVGTVEAATADTAETTRRSADALDTIARATPDLANGLDGVRGALGTAAGVSDSLESVLRAVGRLPGVPDYAPAEPLATTLRRAQDQLGPVVDQLRAIDRSTGALGSLAPTLAGDLDQAHRNLVSLHDDLVTSRALLEQYRASAQQARAVADRSRTDLSADLTTTRLLVVLGGLAFTVGQIVPLWVGRTLLAGGVAAGARLDPPAR